ncbi:MAG: Gfo/Idh/MocA family oxidoreductase [Planctomycetes bacterium]|nr:Gfo/Idh/MocA family oxidoreductase [Planctomycetota bacterium]
MAHKALIVGCGGMGKGWIKNVQGNPRAEVTALMDVRIDAARSAAKEFGLDEGRAFDDLERAITECRPDFVVDVTVPEAHCSVTVKALEMGAPVIGEKPMAESMESARKMVRASEKSGKLYMVSQSRRYDVKHVACKGALKSNAIGPITMVNCDFYIGAHFGGFRDEMSSPLILDMAIHHFDLCRFLTGADAFAVYAHEFNPKGSWYKGDPAATVIFEMTDGIVFTYRGSWCAEGCHTSWNGDWRIIGERGTILMEKDQMPHGQRVVDMDQESFNRDLEDVQVDEVEITGTGIGGSLNEFLDCLESGDTPQCECHDNIKSLAMVFGAIESSRKGQTPVRVVKE